MGNRSSETSERRRLSGRWLQKASRRTARSGGGGPRVFGREACGDQGRLYVRSGVREILQIFDPTFGEYPFYDVR
jgi:hypothetical protein